MVSHPRLSTGGDICLLIKQPRNEWIFLMAISSIYRAKLELLKNN